MSGDNEFMRILLKATRKEYSVELDSHAEAIKTRFALYNFRKKMKRDMPHHDLLPALFSVVISISGNRITLGPNVSLNPKLIAAFDDDNENNVFDDLYERPETVPFTPQYDKEKLGLDTAPKKTGEQLYDEERKKVKEAAKEAYKKLGFNVD